MNRIYFSQHRIKKLQLFFCAANRLAVLMLCFFCMAFFSIGCKPKAPKVNDSHNEKQERNKEQQMHGKEEGHEHGGGEFGPDKGVQKYEEGKGIVLAPVAEKRLGVGYEKLERFRKKQAYLLPASALIMEENTVGVYVRMGDWIRFYSVRILQKDARQALVEAKLPAASAARLVVKSAALLRLAELNAAGEGAGHH